MSNNVLYAQAGGVTSVINVSAYGVFKTIKKHPKIFGKTYAALNGIAGVLEENLIDIDLVSDDDLEKLKHLPGAVFESCRFDLDSLEKNPIQYQRVLEVFKTYNIGYFFYNGGNGSMITAKKVADYCCQQGHKVICVGVAKTIDNDLAISHCSPGFGSAAKYIATSLAQASIDIQSMYKTSSKFLVMETMGRDTGWLALAGGLVKHFLPNIPLMVLPAEATFKQANFLTKVKQLIAEKGYCVCVVSEGIKDEQSNYISFKNIEYTEEKNYYQLGGTGSNLAKLVTDKLQVKAHAITPDYLQRSATHLVSQVDWQMAYEAGEASVISSMNKGHGTLPVIEVTSTSPFKWQFKNVDLVTVANMDKTVPDNFIDSINYTITQPAIDYLLPLIQGEVNVDYCEGIPIFIPPPLKKVKQKLCPFKLL